jgi:hypothetical protein
MPAAARADAQYRSRTCPAVESVCPVSAPISDILPYRCQPSEEVSR